MFLIFASMLSYIGGKSKIGKWIKDFYPTDMETYVETFGGMFWCYFNMDLSKYPNLKHVVYNDFNPLNFNLFTCLKNPTELLYAVNQIQCQEFGVSNTPTIYKDQLLQPGYYNVEWDGTNSAANKMASGIYFLQFKTEVFHRTIKMIFQK